MRPIGRSVSTAHAACVDRLLSAGDVAGCGWQQLRGQPAANRRAFFTAANPCVRAFHIRLRSHSAAHQLPPTLHLTVNDERDHVRVEHTKRSLECLGGYGWHVASRACTAARLGRCDLYTKCNLNYIFLDSISFTGDKHVTRGAPPCLFGDHRDSTMRNREIHSPMLSPKIGIRLHFI